MDTGHLSFGVSGEVITSVVEELWDLISYKPIRIGYPDIPVPSAPGLSKQYYSGPAEIASKIAESFKLDLTRDEIKLLKGNGPFDIPPQGLVGPF